MGFDRFAFYQAIKDKALELGEAGFYDWLNEVDEDTHAAITEAFSDPAFGLAPHQQMPTDKHRIWFLLMGRGAGKTFAAACGANHLAEDVFPGGTGILVGATVKDVRDTMIEGESGIIATARPGFVPRYNKHDNILHWPNGSKALVRTADNPEDIRGPTVNWAWCDELVKWPYEASFDNTDRCVRNKHENGTRLIVTTTPKRAKQWIRSIEDMPGCIVSRASSLDNEHMDEAYLEARRQEAANGGARAREEIMGEWVDAEGALWTEAAIEAVRDPARVGLFAMAASMERRLITVDPAGGKGKDETGILLIGWKAGKAYVLADETSAGSTEVWTSKVVKLAKDYFKPGDYVLLETNFDAAAQNVLRMKDRNLRVVPVVATKSKWFRAQEAFAHFCENKVRFWNTHPELEKQLCEWEPEMKKSPDRGDAFTQAINHLFGMKRAPRAPFMSLSGLRL